MSVNYSKLCPGDLIRVAGDEANSFDIYGNDSEYKVFEPGTLLLVVSCKKPDRNYDLVVLFGNKMYERPVSCIKETQVWFDKV